MTDLSTEISWPGRAADDPRIVVTFEWGHLTSPIRFYFLRLIDDTDDSVEYVNTGFEIGEHFDYDPAFKDQHGHPGRDFPEGEEPQAIDAATIRQVTEQYEAHVAHAHARLILDSEGAANARRALLGPSMKPARLTDDFYRLVASQYANHNGTQRELAQKFRTTPSNLSKWLKEARRRGYIEEKS